MLPQAECASNAGHRVSPDVLMRCRIPITAQVHCGGELCRWHRLGRTMRIAMLSVHSSPIAQLGGKEAGGMNVYVRELSRELGRRGIGVDIFTRSQDAKAPTTVTIDRGVRVINLHTGPRAPYDKNWVLDYMPEFVSRVRCFADGRDLTYDLIHSHYWLSGEAALALRRSWGVPMVHMFHTLGAMKNQVARGAEENESSQRIEIERRQMEQVDTIVA